MMTTMGKGLPQILSAHSVPVLSTTLLKNAQFALAAAPNGTTKVDLEKEILRITTPDHSRYPQLKAFSDNSCKYIPYAEYCKVF